MSFFFLRVCLQRLLRAYDALCDLTILDNPYCGRYLANDDMPTIQCFLKNYVLSFQLHRCSNIKQGDWLLSIKQQKLNSLEVKSLEIPIWIFWYRPHAEIIKKIPIDNSFCFYLYETPGVNHDHKPINEIDRVFTIRLPDFAENSLQNIILFLNNIFCEYIGGNLS